MKRIYILLLFIVALFFFHVTPVKAGDIWGINNCLPHFSTQHDVDAIRSCNTPISGNIPGMLCGLKCWNGGSPQTPHWYYRCEPGRNDSGGTVPCPADHNFARTIDNSSPPSGADPNNVLHATCSCGNTIYCWAALATPTNTPTPTFTPSPTQAPGCSTDCTSDHTICQHATGGCTACLPKPGGGGYSCQTPPGCSTACTDNPQCQQAPSDCQTCAKQNPGDSQKVCRSNKSQCGGYCDNTAVSCDSNSGCICNLTTNKCEQPSPTPTLTTAPSSTPTPTPTASACYVGKSCSNCGGNPGQCSPDCNGGWCNGGQCSTCSYVPSGPSHCVKGNSCNCKTGDSCIVKFDEGPDGICTRQSRDVYQITSCGVSPTPTGIQPTQEISMIPTPTVNPTVAIPTSYPTGTTPSAAHKLSQRWVCLKAQPCSDSASGCSAILDHRVKLSVKTDKGDDAKPVPGQPTYIFECIQTSSGHKCTTGDPQRDQEILGSTNYPFLAAAPPAGYGYNYGGMYYADGSTVAPNPVPGDNNINGDIGVYEWESYTHSNVPRIFLAMNKFDPSTIGGEIGAQQQGILPLLQGGSKKCVQISWDPSGVVYDHLTLQPVVGAQVTLLMKGDDGQYKMVTGNDVLGGVQNPVMTDASGSYNFMVPDGIYKIEVKKDGYTSYTSKDVKQTGKSAVHDVELKKQGTTTFIDAIQDFFKNILP